MVEFLIHNGASINICGSVGDRPLHLACARGNLRIAQLLVEGCCGQKADGMLLYLHKFEFFALI